jgi:hypothetical protein
MEISEELFELKENIQKVKGGISKERKERT